MCKLSSPDWMNGSQQGRWSDPHPLGQLVDEPGLLDGPVLEPLDVLLEEQELLGAQPQLQGGLAVVLGAELHLHLELAALLLEVGDLGTRV